MPESPEGAPLVPDVDAAPLRDPQSKAHHIDACLTDAVEYDKSAGFDRWHAAVVGLLATPLEPFERPDAPDA